MAIRSEDLHESEGVVLQFPDVSGRRGVRPRYLARRLAVGAVILIVGAALIHDGPSLPERQSRRPEAVVGSVAPGDTLWDLARRYSPPGADLRAYVDRLVSANGLAGRPLQAGMRLRLPK